MTPTELSRATGLSVPYASQILKGVRRPSMRAALLIHEKTGMKLGPIASAEDADIEALARVQDAA